MAVLRESSWYQEILKEGLEKGLQQGELTLVIKLVIEIDGDIHYTENAQEYDQPSAGAARSPKNTNLTRLWIKGH